MTFADLPIVESSRGTPPKKNWQKGYPMCRQLFATLVLLTAPEGIVSRIDSAPPSTTTEPAGQETTHTDRFGDPLPKRAIMRIGTLRFCQPSPSRVVFSPDGKFFASGGSDKRIRLWDPDTGHQLRVLEGHTESVDHIALSGDGKWLASGDHYGELFLWEVDSATVRRRFRGPDAPIGPLALSPNGKVLAASCYRGKLSLWDTDTGKEIRSLGSPTGARVEAMTFTPDSKFFAFKYQAYEGNDQGIQLMDVATGKVIRKFQARLNRTDSIGEGLTFTTDGATLIASHSDGFLRAWDVASGKEKRRYGDGTKGSRIHGLALSHDEKTVAYSEGLWVHIRDLATNKDRVPPWNSFPDGVNSVAYSPDGKKLALGCWRMAVLDTATGKRLNPAPASEGRIRQILYSPDGKVLAVWRDWGHDMIELWDTAQWRTVAILRTKWWKEGLRWDEGGRFRAMAFSPNGKDLTTVEGQAVNGKSQVIICHWQPQTGSRQKEFSYEGGWIDSLSYSGDGETLAWLGSSPRQFFILWNAATGQERGRIPCSDLTLEHIDGNPQLSPVGSLLACGSWKNTVVLWDTKTGNQIRRFGQRRASHDTLAFSPDGRSIATPAGQGMYRNSTIHPDVVLWETATGMERLRIVRKEGHAHQIAFSPNGRLLAWVDYGGGPHVYDDRIHVWDSWTGKEVGQLTGHRGVIGSISFAPDGKTLASGGTDKTILIWDVSGLLPATKPAAEKRSRAELAKYWDDLAGTDAARAYRSIAELSRHPDQTVGFLKDNLAGHPSMIAEKLAKLIADLDDDNFQTRENASKELSNLGRLAENALRKAMDGKPSAEVKRRVQDLLDRLGRTEHDPVQLQLLRAAEVLERIATPEAQLLLGRLVKESGDANVVREAHAALERLRKASKQSP